MENISSRKNPYIRHLRLLASEGAYRQEQGEFVCDGMKLLQEALAFGGRISSLLWRDKAQELSGLEGISQYTAPGELFDFASPMKNSPGPLFTVKMRPESGQEPISKAIVLEGVQDPGNVGTVIRTANAFAMDAVILTDGCADLYNPKTVRSSMGAIFRQRVIQVPLSGLQDFLEESQLPLYGAALSENARDVRSLNVKKAALAIGSEGRGLSKDLLDICKGRVIIPMQPDSESLNAAVAAAVLMWEMYR